VRQLVVTDGAVEKHKKNIFIKLNLAADEELHRRSLQCSHTFAASSTRCHRTDEYMHGIRRP